jgi:hypothetical protein
MEPDIDDEQLASLMVDWYGDGAGRCAEQVMNWSLQIGELNKYEYWRRVCYAIVRLQSKPPEAGPPD